MEKPESFTSLHTNQHLNSSKTGAKTCQTALQNINRSSGGLSSIQSPLIFKRTVAGRRQLLSSLVVSCKVQKGTDTVTGL